MSQVAKLKTVIEARLAMQRLQDRTAGLPGLGLFTGPSGRGKSTAASWLNVHHNAYYVACLSVMTRRSFCESLCQAFGIEARGTTHTMVLAIANELVSSGRPLIIDEFDHLVERKSVEVVRDIYECAQSASILLIGEESLPQKLNRWERFAGRVSVNLKAPEPTVEDVAALMPIYASGIEIAPDMGERLLSAARGSIRRVCVGLNDMREVANSEGWSTITAELWGRRALGVGS